jgi:hypothetical protein
MKPEIEEKAVRNKSYKINFGFILILLAFVLSTSPTALAWKEQMHKGQLTPMALDLVKLLHSKSYPSEIWMTFRGFRGFIEQGAWDEDFPCGRSGIRANNHYYHPLSGRGLSDAPWIGLGDPDVDTLTWAAKNLSLDPAEEFNGGDNWACKGWGWTVVDVDIGDMSWKRAIERYGYTEDSKRLAYYTLGFLCHLLQDMGCPEHVHDDPHGASGYTGFEWWVWHYWDSLKPPFLGGLKPRKFDRFEDFFRNLSLLGYSIDRFRGGELNRESGTTDKSSDLEKMFKVRYKGAGAEWVLENYNGLPIILRSLSPVVGIKVLNSDFKWNWGNYRRDPLGTKGHDQGEWWPTSMEIPGSPSNDEEGYYYIELSGDLPGEPFNAVADLGRNFSPAAFLPSPLPKVADQCTAWRAESAGGLDLYSLIGMRIFPPIVEHTAGLIEHFFDIVNHPPFVKTVQVSQPGGGSYSVFWKDMKEPPSRSISITDVRERSLTGEFKNLPGEKDEISYFSPGHAVICITFSEPVQSVAVKMGGRTVSGSLDKDESVWTGDFVIEDGGPPEETRAISIDAEDKNNHYGNEGGRLDGNPETPAKRIEDYPDYRWIKYESGEDTRHSIQIKRIKKEDEQLKVMSDIDLISGTWAFGRVLEGSKKFFLCRLVLTKTRGEHGYEIRGCHPNESYWELMGRDTILFRHKDGSITSRLTRRRDGYWEGPYIPHKSAPVRPGETAKPHYIER